MIGHGALLVSSRSVSSVTQKTEALPYNYARNMINRKLITATSFIMPFATITSKGQTNIPKSIRQQLALDSGDRILFAVDENGAVSFEPAIKDITELRGIVPKPEKPVSVEDMKSAVKSAALDRAGHP